MLGRFGAAAGKCSIENAQAPDVIGFEQSPAWSPATRARPTQLVYEDSRHCSLHAVVVRLRHARRSTAIPEFDQMAIVDGANQIVMKEVHDVALLAGGPRRWRRIRPAR